MTDQLDLVCGNCEFWRASDVLEETPPKNGTPILGASNDDGALKVSPGHCWRFPPTQYLVQQRHAMTNEIQMGTMSVRPTVTDKETACGEFELRGDIDSAGVRVDIDPP